ncbi:hypothetical protein BGZ49_005746, partial [Haplosporangium sp. Z 27]
MRQRKAAQDRRKRTEYLNKIRGRAPDISDGNLTKRLEKLAREELDDTPTFRRKALRSTTESGDCGTLGIMIPKEALEQLEEMRTRLKDEISVTLYSDGSMTDAGSPNVSMAFGVVLKDCDESFPIVTTGRVAG